jgi:hypothetical protein
LGRAGKAQRRRRIGWRPNLAWSSQSGVALGLPPQSKTVSMKLLETITQKFPPPRLTAKRIVLAFAVAMSADAVQLAMVPLGPLAVVPHEAIDVVAMALTCWLLGFHVLLLPTFVLELIPVVGGLSPTWTACVAAVVALRKREQSKDPAPIEVSATPIASTPPQLPPAESANLTETSSRSGDGVDANPS